MLGVDLIDRIYDAVVEPQRWIGVVRDICRAFEAHSGVFAFSDNQTELSSVAIAHGVFEEPAVVASYFAYFGAIDTAVPLYARTETGKFIATSKVLAARDLARNEFYNDFFLKLGLNDSVGGNVVRDERGTAMFCMQRAMGARTFQDDEIARIETLGPHLRRAMQLHRVFSPMRAAAASFSDVLKRVPVGVLLIDHAGRVWHRNAAAREVIARRDGLTLSAGGALSPTDRSADARLSRILGSVLTAGSSHPGGRVLAPRSAGKPPYALLVAPVTGETFSIFDAPARRGAMVLISDPERVPRGELESAMARYRLTPAELGLLSGLVGGRSLRDYCDEQRISINTGKFHLRSLFAKTDTHGQVGLVRAALIAMRSL